MIIKNFLSKIKISKYSLILLLICFITGLIKELIVIFILVIFHEFGHYLVSYFFKWNIDKIIIYPFGGIIKYNELIDKPLLEELLITISGPINQMIIYLILINLFDYKYITNYNYSMLIFNLLPIIPLDGSKLLNIILNKIFNFRISYIILYIISIISLSFFIVVFKNKSYIIVISFLIYELINYIKNKEYIYNKFMLEKYLYNNNYNKYKKINNIKKMKRNKKHLIRYKDYYITEKDYLKKEYNS